MLTRNGKRSRDYILENNENIEDIGIKKILIELIVVCVYIFGTSSLII